MFECLRLYSPSVSAAPRYTAEGAELGGYTFPSASTIMMNFHGCHINPKHWPQPEEFMPMRFSLDDEMKARAVFPEGFFPFGYGGHSCIGKALALEVTMTAVAMLVLRYRVEPAPGHPETEFNTTNSEQILGFTEPVNGAYITLTEMPATTHVAAATTSAPATPVGADVTPRDASLEMAKNVTLGNAPLTMAAVASHKTKESCWIVIDGKVYDITEFLNVHPGGPRALLQMGGKDATRMFRDVIRHTDFAEAEREKYCIGPLQPAAKL